MLKENMMSCVSLMTVAMTSASLYLVQEQLCCVARLCVTVVTACFQGTIWTSSWCDTSADGRVRSSSPFRAMSQIPSTPRRLPACPPLQTEVRLLPDCSNKTQ